MAEQEQQKDTIIFVKAVGVGEDSKQRQKIDLRFSEEETLQLIIELAKIKSRAKLQIHLGEGEYGPTAFLYVKEVMTMEEVRAAKKTNKGNSLSADKKSKISALKNNA